MAQMAGIIIYQLLPRLFGNQNPNCIPYGTIEENGSGKFIDISLFALTAIKRLHATHIWLTGILEHASTTDYLEFGMAPVDVCLVKGKAGSPFAIRDYYDVCPDLAQDVPQRVTEFTSLLERCHESGLKVIIDFVPNHLFRQYASDALPDGKDDFGRNDNPQLAFSPQNNFYYLPGTLFLPPVAGAYTESPAKVTGNDCFAPNPGLDDWYETVKLNYGVDVQHGGAQYFDTVPDTWYKMRDVLSFWAAKGVDGFRCDMAEMVPAPFWAWVIPQIKTQKNHPLFIAEIYRPQLYPSYVGAGFDYLYDKVGLYDTLKGVLRGERPASDISNCWQRLGPLQPYMLNFLENHDEQRIASDFFMGDGYKALPALVVSTCLNTASFMLYAGQEFGERGMDSEGFSALDGRTSIFDYWSVGTLRRFNHDGRFDTALLTDAEGGLYKRYIDLFSLVSTHPALVHGAMYDLCYANQHNAYFDTNKQFAFLRHAEDTNRTLLVAVNFGDGPADIKISIPEHAFDCLAIPDHTLVVAQVLFGVAAGDGGMLDSMVPFPVRLEAWGAHIVEFVQKRRCG